jgi:hypothetical protein
MGEVRFPCENSISSDVNLFHVLLHLGPKRISLPQVVDAKAKANRQIRFLHHHFLASDVSQLMEA